MIQTCDLSSGWHSVSAEKDNLKKRSKIQVFTAGDAATNLFQSFPQSKHVSTFPNNNQSDLDALSSCVWHFLCPQNKEGQCPHWQTDQKIKAMNPVLIRDSLKDSHLCLNLVSSWGWMTSCNPWILPDEELSQSLRMSCLWSVLNLLEGATTAFICVN